MQLEQRILVGIGNAQAVKPVYKMFCPHGVCPHGEGTYKSSVLNILIKSFKSVFILQDLPEFFEDNMETWMNNFHTLLTLDNKLLQTDVSI